MRVALASYRCINGDTRFNLTQIERGLAAASAEKAQLLCFGESFLQGFDALTWDYEKDRQIAVTQEDPCIRQLCARTSFFGVDLLFGYFEREENRIYSSCLLLGDGRILHNYRRISAGWKERLAAEAHYCEGEDCEPILYRGRRIALGLCGDLWEAPERFKGKGSELLFWPIYVNFSEEVWVAEEQAYAAQAAVAAPRALLVNSVTREQPEAVGGAFVFAQGNIAARLSYGEEGILLAEV